MLKQRRVEPTYTDRRTQPTPSAVAPNTKVQIIGTNVEEMPPQHQQHQPQQSQQPTHHVRSATHHPQDPGAQDAKNGAITSQLPNNIEVVIDEIITDTSTKRVNSSGQTVYKQYKRGRYLGKGGFAKCYELQSLDSLKIYAGKIIPKASITKPSAKKKLIAEISIHRKIHHTNVVKFERFFEDAQNVYILLEICTNHTLMELVKRRHRLTETETQFYMWQLTTTMIHLHEQNIIHRDLKLGNLFLNSQMDIRIGDFGLAAQLEHPDERKRTICGTPNYIAPEILDNSNGHSFEVDTWAMGVIMYTMLIGQPPFETASVKTTYKKIRDNSYEFPNDVIISPAARSLIERILSSSPNARPSLTEMKNDPFFTQSPFPKQLPVTILKTPLVWKHTWHASLENNENNVPGAQFMNNNPSRAGGLTNRPMNIMPAPVDTKSQVSAPVKNAITRPLTAPVIKAPPEVKVPSPLAQPPPQKRLSSATPIEINPLVTAPATMMPAPSPVYTTETSQKGFFKDVVPVTSNTVQIAVPKRVSGGNSRASSRRTSCEEKEQQDELVNGMKNLDLKTDVAPTAQSEDAPDAAEDEEDVKKMHDEIERSFCQPMKTESARTSIKPTSPTAVAPAPIPAELWVNKWVDYSNKYGLGYLLSNGDSGVYFNDSSKAILSSDGEHFEYMERKPSEAATSPSSQPERQQYTLSNYPASLQKKVTLLKHFMNYLVPPTSNDEVKSASPTSTARTTATVTSSTTSPSHTSPSSTASPSIERVYVKKWLRTKHAIFFRLSNRTVQVIFIDQTELVLSTQYNSVTFTDKNKKRETFSLDQSGETSVAVDGLAKRMKYTKDILHHLLSRATPTAGAPIPEKKF